MTALLYFALALAATVLGGLAGIGGGMIIRPALGMLGAAAPLASFTSAATVLAMAAVNVGVAARRGEKIALRGTLALAAGSVAGGFLGGSLMDLASPRTITALYAAAMALVLAVVLLRKLRPELRLRVTYWPAHLLAGLVTGTMSGFFGIGGGPFQMAALLIIVGLEERDAALQSTFITLLTTMSALARYCLAGHADLSLLAFALPGGVLGGLIGGALRPRLPGSAVTALLGGTVAVIFVQQIVRLWGWGG